MNMTFLRRWLAMGLLLVMTVLALPMMVGARQVSNATLKHSVRMHVRKVSVTGTRRIRVVRAGYWRYHRWHHWNRWRRWHRWHYRH